MEMWLDVGYVQLTEKNVPLITNSAAKQDKIQQV
jgi:hypothetical protein